MDKTVSTALLIGILAQACVTAPSPSQPLDGATPLYAIEPLPPPDVVPLSGVAGDEHPLLSPDWVQDAPLPSGAEQAAAAPKNPWEKFSLTAGVLLVAMNSGVRFGPSGLGVSVNLEELLGFDTTVNSARVGGSWRFTKNRKHRIDLAWIDLSRTGSKTLQQDLDLGNGNIIPAGSGVKSSFDLNIIKTEYSYSFFQDERFDLAAAAGLYVMPMDFSLSASGFSTYSDSVRTTAPLPLVGLRMDFLLTPKWYLRSDLSLFYLEYEDYTGSMRDFTGAVEYKPWEHFALGFGVNSFGFNVEHTGSSSVPGVNFTGEVDFGYTGVMLYLRGLW